MGNIRTVASLSKEKHFVEEYQKLTDIPYKYVDLCVMSFYIDYIKTNGFIL